jgi:hypothetical protein
LKKIDPPQSEILISFVAFFANKKTKEKKRG